MTRLLTNLTKEVTSFSEAGCHNLNDLLNTTNDFLHDLKQIEKTLEMAVDNEDQNLESPVVNLDIKQLDMNQWYNKSISSLKSYNTQINKFLKNILTNPLYTINLDEAYTYPLNIDSIPLQHMKDDQGLNDDELALRQVKQENQEELIKAIILHLLKIGQSDIIKDMIEEPNELGKDNFNHEGNIKHYNFKINAGLLDQFKSLNEIVDDILTVHDLTKALQWFKDKYNENVIRFNGISTNNNRIISSQFEEIEFKFHMLKFTLLLNGEGSNDKFSLDSALEAYIYSKENFPKFFHNYLHELAPLMSLLLFKTLDNFENNSNPDDYARKHMINLLSEFTDKMKLSFIKSHENAKKRNESKFVQDILDNFENIHDSQYIFISLANEFISYYCKDMNLSNDSSLFQSILSGFINLPSFYKYNKIQRKLSRVSMSVDVRPILDIHENGGISILNSGVNNMMVSTTGNYTNTPVDNHHNNAEPPTNQNIISPYTFDLPFQLSDTNRFLFNYHPIFICPVSKEQLIPLTIDEIELSKKPKRPRLDFEKREEIKNNHNPVVVLKYCHHVALKESIWQLSKRGSEVFKCHYCYKRHKFSEVSEAYFIDL